MAIGIGLFLYGLWYSIRKRSRSSLGQEPAINNGTRQGGTNPTGPNPVPQAPVPRPATESGTVFGKIWKVVWRLAVWTIVIAVLILGYKAIDLKHTEEVHKLRTAVVEAAETKEVQKWTFLWRLPPGETEQGRNQHIHTVEIMENNSKSFKAVLHDRNNRGKDARVGGLTLDWVRGDLIGTWSNYLDGDGGNAYLYKGNGEFWSGDWIHKDGTKTHIELKKTTTK
jgi:hypothetical protein